MVVSQKHSGGSAPRSPPPPRDALRPGAGCAGTDPSDASLCTSIGSRGLRVTDSELFIISRSLLLTLQTAAQETLTFVESPELAAPAGSVPAATADHLTTLAKSAGADAWVWVQIAEEPAALHLTVRSFDLFDQQMVLDLSVSREKSPSLLDLPYEKWKDIVAPVLDTYQGPVGTPRSPQTAVITIRALPGNPHRNARRTCGNGGPGRIRAAHPCITRRIFASGRSDRVSHGN